MRYFPSQRADVRPLSPQPLGFIQAGAARAAQARWEVRAAGGQGRWIAGPFTARPSGVLRR